MVTSFFREVKKCWPLMLFLSFFSTEGHGIVEVKSYKSFIANVLDDMGNNSCDPNTTFILSDVDEVMITLRQSSDNFQTYEKHFLVEGTFFEGINMLPMEVTFLPLTRRLANETRQGTLDDGWNPFHFTQMKYLQSVGVSMGQNARWTYFNDFSIKRRDAVGNEVEMVNLHPQMGDSLAVYRGGTLMSSGMHKGKVLKAFFENIRLFDQIGHGRKVCLYFIDDVLENVQEVKDSVEEMKSMGSGNIHFRGFHYANPEFALNAIEIDLGTPPSSPLTPSPLLPSLPPMDINFLNQFSIQTAEEVSDELNNLINITLPQLTLSTTASCGP